MAVSTSLKIKWDALTQRAQKSGPRCGTDQCHNQGTKRRVVLTRFGCVELPLRRMRCQACRRLIRPAVCSAVRYVVLGDGTEWINMQAREHSSADVNVLA